MTEYIKEYSNNNQALLEKQISNIVLRQQELQNFMTTLEQAVSNVEVGMQIELKQPKINYNIVNNMQKAMTRSMELLVKMYDSYRSFEDTKFKYFKQLNDVNYNFIKLLEVDIRRLDEKVDKITNSQFMDMMTTLVDSLKGTSSNTNPVFQEGKKELLDDPEYKI